ncbi:MULTISPECIES: Mov34/MPN/PAD-1 family protein [unclassified Bradyrhizobium]|uniref:Mov34/MPN/PAD-1 family protein n=1 Tax=unclassified Bradyrhizobium TaxID=2631580 RepID=UPI0028EAABFC|nr:MULTISPECIES: Mov34/MPN/PAD-1 family protein [unclassified Bradyrhizobium]
MKFEVKGLAVRVSPQALAVFDAHRQRRFYHREAGGQLFARVRGHDWEIIAATGPRSRDIRGRGWFRPHRASEQEEIFRHHEMGLDYVGDWHTHPEDLPTPSGDDLTSITDVVRQSTHHLPGFLLLIVGREPFPGGLWASFHSVEGRRFDAKGLALLRCG